MAKIELDTSKNSVFKQMEAFAIERHRIYLRRASGQPFPWTDDPILQKYKFNNIYRELDKTTVWIHERIRRPFAKHEYLWFMIVLARHFNRIDVLEDLVANCWPINDNWSPSKLKAYLRRRQVNDLQIWNSGAYRISNALPKQMDTVEYICDHVFAFIWKNRKSMIQFMSKSRSCSETWNEFRKYPNFGSFIPAQVTYDLMNTRYLAKAYDLNSWSGCGTGSVKGLDLVFGRADQGRLWTSKILSLHDQHLEEVNLIRSKLRWPSKWPALTAQDVENILCEFSKYRRAIAEGRSKSFVRHT